MKNRFLLALLMLFVACGGSSTETSAATDDRPEPPTSRTTAEPEVAEPVADDDGSVLSERTNDLGSALFEPPSDPAPTPVGLSIESIGVVAAPVVDVGVEPNGEMEIPGATEIGWYRYGPTPGDAGSAVLAAHIAFNGRDGVFRDLDDIEVGAIVEIRYEDGSSQRFRVIETAQYAKDELPVDRIFAKAGAPQLTLITCGGDFNRSLRSYSDNVVAYAEPIG